MKKVAPLGTSRLPSCINNVRTSVIEIAQQQDIRAALYHLDRHLALLEDEEIVQHSDTIVCTFMNLFRVADVDIRPLVFRRTNEAISRMACRNLQAIAFVS
jgi:hypothetical protein